MPQFKVRSHEITSSKSLMIVKKDPWNLVEDFYEPGKEFVYFENFKQLEEIIEDVSKNFHNYEDVIEAAYKRSKDYTVENIYRYIQTNDKSLITWSNNNV
jgi:spore maturation protein CgeB